MRKHKKVILILLAAMLLLGIIFGVMNTLYKEPTSTFIVTEAELLPQNNDAD